ncbi:ABC transporter permease [Sporosalibacterium faouarense]|uniref:ABC transporter permease n=1 Tax=Sporosalibacterium faouarense TaxID=516123 RepID=UPI001A9C721F|nr:ABC transporter permease subunit [Sporosalibacterium faouarense]
MQNRKPYLLILPSLLATVFLFIGGILYGIFESIGFSPLVGEKQVTLKYYLEIFNSDDFWQAFFTTIRIASLSTIFSVILGVLIIYFLYIMKVNKKNQSAILAQRLFQVPMLFPYLVFSYIVYIIFSSTGWCSRILYGLGIIDSMDNFPIMINDRFGWGIIIAYVWKTSPFVVLMLYPVLLKVPLSLIDAAKVFGANKFTAFKEVVFPLLISPLKLSAFIVFSYSFLAFEVPYILGVTYPKTLSVYSYLTYTTGNLSERPKAMAINIASTFCVIVIGLIFYLLKKGEGNEG